MTDTISVNGEQRQQDQETAAWITFAETDLKTAEYLLNGAFYPLPLEIICYHSQQAAEKAVKALIVYFGKQGGIPKQHDISFLLNQIKILVKSRSQLGVTEELMDYADNLTQYGIAPRYPNEMNIDEEEAKYAVRQAGTILQWAKNIIADES